MKIINKIKQLLNQTVENGCTEHEAQAAFTLARKLMIKYKIEEFKLNLTKSNEIVKLKVNLDCHDYMIYDLIKIFIQNFGIMHFMINENDKLICVLFGDKINVAAVDVLIKCAYEYIEKNGQLLIKEYKEIFGVKDEALKRGYFKGFNSGLNDKYQKQNSSFNEAEALMVAVNNNVKKEFDKFTHDFQQKTIEYKKDKISTVDMIAITKGYNDGLNFGTTGITE